MTITPRARCAVLPGDFVNLGDAMLSLAAARRMARDGARVALLPYRRPSAAIRQEFGQEGFDVVAVRDQPWRALCACLRASIWIGGGHAVRKEISLGWLLFTATVAGLARLCGHRVRLIGAGASAVPSGWRRRLFGLIFATCDKLCVRDADSVRSLLADFPGAAPKVTLAADVAFLKGRLDIDADRLEPFCCVVSPGIDIVEGRREDPEEILAVLGALVEHCALQHVIVVSHDSRDEFGLPFCQALEARVRAALPVTVEVVSRGRIGDGLLEPYGRAHWIVTGRLHGLIIGAKLSRRVFYTTGSASKLRPFADLFAYGPATRMQALALPSDDPQALRVAIARQERAAELNFA